MNVAHWVRARFDCLFAFSLVAVVLLLRPLAAEAQTPVGSTSVTQTVTVSIATSGTLQHITGYLQGTSQPEFVPVSPNGGSCAIGTAYTAPTSCTVQYTFSPTRPWTRYGAISLTDNSTPSLVLGTAFVTGVGQGPQVSYPLSSATVFSSLATSLSTVYGGVSVNAAGDLYYISGNSVDERAATSSSPTTVTGGLNGPSSLAIDGAGNVYVADSGNNEVKEIVAIGGAVTSASAVVVIGTGFSDPLGVAVDGRGNVYVADTGNNDVKEIVAIGGVLTSTINTLGSGFSAPGGVAVDANGNVYVADSGHSEIKELVAVDGAIPSSSPTINTLGSGFNSPAGVAVDGMGNVYVANKGGGNVQEILTGGSTILTLGSGFASPYSVAVDAGGNVFVEDPDNSQNNGFVAELNAQTAPALTFTASTAVGSTSTDSPRTATLANNGNEPLTFASPVITAGFNLDSSSTCTQNPTLAAGSSCTYAVDFLPVTAGSPTGNLTIADNSLNPHGSTQVILLSGTSTKGTPTLSASNATAVVDGPAVTLTASVAFAGVAPTGTVSFTVNGVSSFNASCPASASPLSCTASYTPTGLMASMYPIQASIAADTNYNAASSPNATLTVDAGTPVVMVLGSGNFVVDGSPTLTATITPNTGIRPGGTVTFSTGLAGGSVTAISNCQGKPLVPSTGPPASLTATCNSPLLQAGSNSITATLVADANFKSATSTALVQTVTQATPAVSLTGPSSPSTVDAPVTFTATITPNSGIVPGGKVSFTTTLSGNPTTIPGCSAVTLVGSAGPVLSASCPTAALLDGTNSITATLARDSNFVSATSSPLSQVINRAATTLALSSSVTGAAVVDQSIVFTATLSATNAFTVTPTGTVNFTTGAPGSAGTSIPGCGTQAVNGTSYAATCSTASLGAPSALIYAVYTGDTNFVPSTSPQLAQVITKNTPSVSYPTTSYPSGTASSVVDQSITLSATITPSSASSSGIPPTGSVIFREVSASGTILCGPTVVTPNTGNGTASASCTPLPPPTAVLPSTPIYAVYSGDSNFTAGNAPSISLTVLAAPTTTTVTSPTPTPAVNQSVTLTATVAPTNVGSGYPGTATPQSGTIVFNDSAVPGTPFCFSAYSAGAPVTCTHSFLSAGTHTITATFTTTDSNFSSSNPSAGVAEKVGAASGITLTITSAGAVTVNQQATFSAAFTPAPPPSGAQPSGTATYLDGGTAISTCTNLVVSGGAVPNCTETMLNAGTHNIAGSFTDTDGNFATIPSSSVVSFPEKVLTNSTAVAFISPSSPSGTSADQNVTFTATVTPATLNPAATGSTLPTGSVSFTYSLVTPSGTSAGTICSALIVIVNASAQATCSQSLSLAGTYTVTATYNNTGDSNFSPPDVAPKFSYTVAATGTSLAIGAPPNATINVPAQFLPALTITPTTNSSATVPTGLVTLTDGTGGPTICSVQIAQAGTITCNLYSFLTAGSHIISAMYAGDNNFGSSSASTTLKVNQAAPQIKLSASATTSVATQTLTFVATVTGPAGAAVPGNPTTSNFSFSIAQGTTIFACSSVQQIVTAISDSATCTITFPSTVLAGTIDVAATYDGDSNYTTVTSATVPEIVQNFNVLITPAQFTMAQGTPTVANTNANDAFGGAPSLQYSLATVNSFSDPVSVSCAVKDSSGNLATDLTCAPTPTAAIPFGITVTSTATSATSTPLGLYTIQLTITDQANTGLFQTATASVTIINQPASVFAPSAGTVTAAFSLSPSVAASATGLACNNAQIGTSLPDGTYTTSTGQSLQDIGVTCSAVQSTGTNTYSVTFTAGSQATAQRETSRRETYAATLGLPLVFLLLIPANRRSRRSMPQILGILLLTLATLTASGCGSGGFTRTTPKTALAGSYLIEITDTQGAVVAEIPLIIGN